jgi:hypothetical protein
VPLFWDLLRKSISDLARWINHAWRFSETDYSGLGKNVKRFLGDFWEISGKAQKPLITAIRERLQRWETGRWEDEKLGGLDVEEIKEQMRS